MNSYIYNFPNERTLKAATSKEARIRPKVRELRNVLDVSKVRRRNEVLELKMQRAVNRLAKADDDKPKLGRTFLRNRENVLENVPIHLTKAEL